MPHWGNWSNQFKLWLNCWINQAKTIWYSWSSQGILWFYIFTEFRYFALKAMPRHKMPKVIFKNIWPQKVKLFFDDMKWPHSDTTKILKQFDGRHKVMTTEFHFQTKYNSIKDYYFNIWWFFQGLELSNVKFRFSPNCNRLLDVNLILIWPSDDRKITFQTEFNNDFKDFKSQIDNLQGQLCTFMDNCFDKENFAL